MSRPLCLVMPLLCLALASAAADVALQTPAFTLALGEDAVWRSLKDTATGRECIAADPAFTAAVVWVGEGQFPATSASAEDGGLVLGFAGGEPGGPDTRLHYRVETADNWLVFRLQRIEGARPSHITLLRLPIGITDNVGPRLNIAWDQDLAVCLMAANRQVDCVGRKRKYAELSAATQDAPGPAMEGAAVALIVSPTPRFKAVAREASHAFGLLTNEDTAGTPAKDTELTRGSYWFLSFGETEVDQVIDYCRQAGVNQVMMSFGAWCTSAGHYPFSETRYPHGREGLKAVVDKLHQNGILVGMHTFVSKVSKADAYVTPIPDKRFWRDREASLAEGIDATQDRIRAATDLRDWPGSPVATQKYWEGGVDKHREVIIGDEIIQYQSIGPEGRWDTFEGCKRGAWGTTAAAHDASTPAYHYGVDGCINGYIIDQETDLQDEVAQRIADIFNDCGFDMVYFDGGEDVDRRRFGYYVSNFQEQAVRRFSRRPVVHMGTIMTHLLWHSFARSSTVDTYLNTLHGAIIAGAAVDKWPTVRDHIDTSVRYMLSVGQDMMPGELGWFGIWPKGQNTDGLQLDETEYLMCKSLAYDVPISLQTGFGQMQDHPLTPGILRIVREYEQLRLSHAVLEEQSAPLRELGKDFALVQVDGARSFVPVTSVDLVGGTHDVRAMVGDTPEGSIATIWHYLRDGHVLLPLPSEQVRLVDIGGEPVPFATEDGRPVIPVGPDRNTLLCRGVSVQGLREALGAAKLRLRPVQALYIRAAEAEAIEGEMALGSAAGVDEPEALGDVIVCTGRPAPATPQQWYAQYTVNIPHAGRWFLWARVRYPSGSDDSFGLARPEDALTLSGEQVLGNCGQNQKQWHWTGRGAGSTAVPPGSVIALQLPEGPFTFRIYAREGPGTAAGNPRLDVLCLADEPAYVPTDELARQALSLPKPGP